MDQTSGLTPEQQENLVAYLDGELDEEATLEIDRALTQDAKMRQEVDMLTRTWDMLEVLPNAKASGEFTQRTLSTIQVEKSRPVAAKKSLWSRWVRRGAAVGGGAAALAVVAAAGFFATHRWIPDESEPLVRELPLIENLDMYVEVDSVEFLQQLQASGLFDEEPFDE